MPFEIAPQTKEQRRVELGRSALAAIAERVMKLDTAEFNMGSWHLCAMGKCQSVPEVTATGLNFNGDGWPVIGDRFEYDAIGAAFGITESDAEFLFSSTGYNRSPVLVDGVVTMRTRPVAVYDRIRDYLATHR